MWKGRNHILYFTDIMLYDNRTLMATLKLNIIPTDKLNEL